MVWLAGRQPKWMTSNILTIIGVLGSVLIFLGYALSGRGIGWLWLASAGFLVNWYGDSLDGSLARVRGTQRPVYGFYLDHMVDVFNELLMFVGLGLSPLLDMRIALALYAAYLMLTVNVSIDAHLKSEFRLTYAGLGPTEFRILAVLLNTALVFIRPMREFTASLTLFGAGLTLTAIDIAGIVIFVVLLVVVLASFFKDLGYYAKVDPPKRPQ